MNRRRFLAGSVVAGSVLSLPWVIREAFFGRGAASSPDLKMEIKKERTEIEGPQPQRWLSAQFAHAQSQGKPLLVLLTAEGKNGDRGHAWGELINHGSPEQLAPLALCEVVCASYQSVEEVFAVTLSRDAWAALIETSEGQECNAATPLYMPNYEALFDYETSAQTKNKLIEERILILSKMLKELIVPDTKARKARIEQSISGIARAEIRKITTKRDANGSFDLLTAERFAALLFESEVHREALSEVVKKKLSQRRIPGAKWARNSACGSIVEGEEDKHPMLSCGLGHSPEKTRRFLLFITNPEEAI